MSIKHLFSDFLCVFLLVCLCVPAVAVNMIRLEYQDWLWFYDIFDTEDNYALWFDMYSYGCLLYTSKQGEIKQIPRIRRNLLQRK